MLFLFLYNTSNFCVMKYEAKNDSVNNPISEAIGTLWFSLTWQEAKTSCENLESNYPLITENEWLTLANNAVNQGTMVETNNL